MTDDLPRLDPGAMDRLLEMTGGDPAFVDELVATFLEDAVRLLADMRAAAGASSADAMVRPAHSLKSNSASVARTDRLSDHGTSSGSSSNRAVGPKSIALYHDSL